MFELGIWELFTLLVIVLVVFSRRLIEIGTNLAKGFQSFRKTVKDSDEINITSGKNDESS